MPSPLNFPVQSVSSTTVDTLHNALLSLPTPAVKSKRKRTVMCNTSNQDVPTGDLLGTLTPPLTCDPFEPVTPPFPSEPFEPVTPPYQVGWDIDK